jgi:hypothetical protein
MTENEAENNETSLTDKRARGFRKLFRLPIFNPRIYYKIFSLNTGMHKSLAPGRSGH